MVDFDILCPVCLEINEDPQIVSITLPTVTSYCDITIHSIDTQSERKIFVYWNYKFKCDIEDISFWLQTFQVPPRTRNERKRFFFKWNWDMIETKNDIVTQSTTYYQNQVDVQLNSCIPKGEAIIKYGGYSLLKCKKRQKVRKNAKRI